MSIDSLRSPRISRRQRVLAFVAAMTVTGTIVSVVVLSFGAASPETWLAPTPEVMEMAAGCDRQPDRAQRDRCKQHLVAARLAGEYPAVAVAEAPREPAQPRAVRR